MPVLTEFFECIGPTDEKRSITLLKKFYEQANPNVPVEKKTKKRKNIEKPDNNKKVKVWQN